MAKLEEGQTAEYWYKKAEAYRRQVGGLNAANSKLKHKLREKEKHIAELEHLLRRGYSFVSTALWARVGGASFTVRDQNDALNWCKQVEERTRGNL